MPAFIVTGTHGQPWRIPGTVPSLPPAERTNTCGNPECRGAIDHAPDMTIRFQPPSPLPAALAIRKGGH